MDLSERQSAAVDEALATIEAARAALGRLATEVDTAQQLLTAGMQRLALALRGDSEPRAGPPHCRQ